MSSLSDDTYEICKKTYGTHLIQFIVSQKFYFGEDLRVENSFQIRHIRVENYGILVVSSHPNLQILRHWVGIAWMI